MLRHLPGLAKQGYMDWKEFENNAFCEFSWPESRKYKTDVELQKADCERQIFLA